MVQLLLFQGNLPSTFWVETFYMTVHLLNSLLSIILHFSTPHEVLFGVVPKYDYLRTFGCVDYPNLSTTTSHKLVLHSSLCLFLGYPTHHKGYHCLDLTTNKIILSQHVVFAKNSFLYKSPTIIHTNPTPPSTFCNPFHLLDSILTPPIQPSPPIPLNCHFAIPFPTVPTSSTISLPIVSCTSMSPACSPPV